MGIKAFAPASIGNIGIGFDIMGLAIERPGDEVVAHKSDKPGVTITKITGANGKLPYEPEKNTASVAVQHFLRHIGEPDRGISLEIHKKMPFGSGLGSSAASAVAAVLAVSELLRTGINKRDLIPFACAGEQLASGSLHADNIAPCMIGGIVLIRDHVSYDLHRLHVPKGLYVAVVYPHVEILTKTARSILSNTVPLDAYIKQSANIGAFIVGLYNSDIGLLSRCLEDQIIEPQRASLIPHFYDVKAAAMAEGALGSSISGSGPSVFALCANSLIAEKAALAMQKIYTDHKIGSDIYTSPVNQEGAVIC